MNPPIPFDDPISPRELGDLLTSISAIEGDSAADVGRIVGVHENTILRWRKGSGLETMSHFLRYFEARGYKLRISKNRR